MQGEGGRNRRVGRAGGRRRCVLCHPTGKGIGEERHGISSVGEKRGISEKTYRTRQKKGKGVEDVGKREM